MTITPLYLWNSSVKKECWNWASHSIVLLFCSWSSICSNTQFQQRCNEDSMILFQLHHKCLSSPFSFVVINMYWLTIKYTKRMIPYASVTFALRRFYDARTTKSPFPCSLRRENLRSLYAFAGIVASTILLNSAQWQICKNHKPVARRYIAVTSYGHHTVIVRTTQGFRLSYWPKNDRRLLR